MPSIEDMNHLQIPLQDILSATDGFDSENFIGEGGYGTVYKGVTEKHGRIAIKWLVRKQEFGQGDHEFKTEIAMLSKYKHENIVSLLGFCDEEDEKMLVNRYESNGSLDRHLNNQDLTWIQRLHICLDAARGLKHLHDNVGSQLGIVHRDVKSSNILLNESWKAKISDFGLSREGPTNPETSYIISNACGTLGYIDPDYRNNGYLTQKSDVYSFGVVLYEVLCGRLAYATWYNDDRRFLSVLVEKHHNRGTLDNIIPSYLRKQMNTNSLHSFSNIAYQCLKNREERPTMKEVVDRLQEALDHQQEVIKKPEEEKKGEEEAKRIAGDDENLNYSPLSPPGQDIILSTHMHCEDCAKKVRQYLKGLEGVESVLTNCETHRVIVKGEKADPLKVLKRLQKKIRKKVELVPLEYILPVEKKDEFSTTNHTYTSNYKNDPCSVE
ncbi:putative serine/threonine-protein kinase PBL28 [Bidens hawaiensis]|uniref:putative serine/threonine-protein kinase PBL28 n=1 Tax=Bidens hawaiensis TaxID=980011 RepID=UPI0040492733